MLLPICSKYVGFIIHKWKVTLGWNRRRVLFLIFKSTNYAWYHVCAKNCFCKHSNHKLKLYFGVIGRQYFVNKGQISLNVQIILCRKCIYGPRELVRSISWHLIILFPFLFCKCLIYSISKIWIIICMIWKYIYALFSSLNKVIVFHGFDKSTPLCRKY